MDQILNLIVQSSVPDNAVQRSVYKEVQRLAANPEFLLSLAFIMNATYEVDVRFIAAIMLKSALRNTENIPPQLE